MMSINFDIRTCEMKYVEKILGQIREEKIGSTVEGILVSVKLQFCNYERRFTN